MSRTTINNLIVAAVIAIAPASSALAGAPGFSAPQFLPGDESPGPAVGMQVEPDIARAVDTYLAVWSDYRTSPDDYPPFASEGGGADVYGVRLDASGNPIDASPIMINEDLGDQVEPKVAWNGSNWLVTWKQQTATLPTYEMLQAVRVAPDGAVLDDPPIVVHDAEAYYNEQVVAGGDGDWVVLFHENGPASDGLRAVLVGGDGTVPDPAGVVVHATGFLLDFDIAFAQDEYLIVWSGSFDSPRGLRFTPDLQPILPQIVLPFAARVATDGTDFLVAWASGPPPSATVEAVLVKHDGGLPNPSGFVLFTAGNQAGTCCPKATWDGSSYWVGWGGNTVARVSPTGHLLDPGGMPATPGTASSSSPELEGAVGGGARLIWNDGVNGADYPKDVYTASIAPSGEVGAETMISGGAPAQLDTDFAAGAGTNLVVYRSRTSGAGRIVAQRIDDDGAALDPEPIEVASGPVSKLTLPSLGAPAAAWNGSLFMITWSDGLQILARRMLADGTFVDATPLTIMDGFDPDVAAVGDVFLIAGIDFLNDNPQWQATHSMRVDGATGATLDPVPNALGGFVIFAQHPQVVTFGSRWLVTWQTNISHDNPAAGTKAAFVDPDGTTPGIIAPDLGWRPQVAVSGDRALFVAVTDTIASAETDLDGQIMLADGTFLGPSFSISDAPDKQLMPAVTWNGTAFIVAWEDKRNSVIYFDERTDVYGAGVSPDGAVLDPAGVPLAASSSCEVDAEFLSVGETTLLAVSTFRADAGLGAYRIGIHSDGSTPIEGDVDGSGTVDVADLLAVLAAWGPCAACAEDVNGDGMVSVVDLLMVLANWG